MQARLAVENEVMTVYAQRIACDTLGNGGCTVNVFTGISPSVGYAVSIYPECERRIESHDAAILSEAIAAYIVEFSDILRSAVNCLGTWDNPEDCLIYLDISAVYQSLEDAIRIGRENSQIAIFDLSTFETIEL